LNKIFSATEISYCHNASKGSLNRLFSFGLDKYQDPNKTAVSLALLNWTGERKYDERLEGRDKTD